MYQCYSFSTNKQCDEIRMETEPKWWSCYHGIMLLITFIALILCIVYTSIFYYEFEQRNVLSSDSNNDIICLESLNSTLNVKKLCSSIEVMTVRPFLPATATDRWRRRGNSEVENFSPIFSSLLFSSLCPRGGINFWVETVIAFCREGARRSFYLPRQNFLSSSFSSFSFTLFSGNWH